MFLINTRDHEMPRRELLQRLGYRQDFKSTYQMLLTCGILEERGAGTKYDPRITRLVRPAEALNG